MATFNTIHIFGFGDVQIIAEKTNNIKKYANLTKVKAVVDKVYALKPEENTATSEYHAINIFDGMHIDFIPKNRDETAKPFRIKTSDIDSKSLTALVTELLA
jgi:hypothetical protein